MPIPSILNFEELIREFLLIKKEVEYLRRQVNAMHENKIPKGRVVYEYTYKTTTKG